MYYHIRHWRTKCKPLHTALLAYVVIDILKRHISISKLFKQTYLSQLDYLHLRAPGRSTAYILLPYQP
jgi:hypothetical protein